jgi:hypothetical protein
VKWDSRGLLILALWVVLLTSGLWASVTDRGATPMRGAWVAQSMRAMVY